MIKMGSGSDVNNGSAANNKSPGTGVWSSDGHGYCLRWNNHKSNLVEILEALIKMECYVDCTIYVDNHVQFKAHRVVLAACSPYFQAILQDAPQDHCSLIFPGVQEFEMRTLLEYIYAGEVNIAESQIPRIMKIAKILEVKGLLDMVDLTSNISQQQQPLSSPTRSNLFRTEINPSMTAEHNKRDREGFPIHPITHSSPIISTSTKISSAQSSSSPPYASYKSPFAASIFSQGSIRSHVNEMGNASGANQDINDDERGRNWHPNIPSLLSSRSAQSMLSSVYETGSDMNPLKRKKLSSISSMLTMTRDTPILRNVLAQSNAPDSSQGLLNAVNLSPPRSAAGNGNGNGSDNIENNDTNNNENNNANNSGGNTSGGNNNGSVYVNFVRKSNDRSYHSSNGSDHSDKKYKDDEPASPYTDKSFDDEPMNDQRRPRESPHEFLAGMRLPPYLQQQQFEQQAQQFQQHHGQGSSGSGSQKPEWKRYKQYTRNDIMSAIECVRNGMSALQASRKFGVPSRTLYDKVKKMGITTGTPRNRSASKRDSGAGPSSSSAAFPYSSLSGAAGAFLYPNQDNSLSQSQDFDPELEAELKQHRAVTHAPLLDPAFLQKLAAEARSEEFRGDALHAMALAAAAHAQFNGMGSSSRHEPPSVLSKFMNQREELGMERERMERERSRSNGDRASSAIKREPVDESDEEMEETEKAENLTLTKQESPLNITPPPSIRTPPFIEQQRGVIMPPMKYSSPRSEPSSITPPCLLIDQPLALDKIDFKQNLNATEAPIALTPTPTANYDE